MRVATAETVLTVPGDLRERVPTSAMTDRGGSILVIETRRETKMATQMERPVMAMSIPAAATGRAAKKKDGSILRQWDQVKILGSQDYSASPHLNSPLSFSQATSIHQLQCRCTMTVVL